MEVNTFTSRSSCFQIKVSRYSSDRLWGSFQTTYKEKNRKSNLEHLTSSSVTVLRLNVPWPLSCDVQIFTALTDALLTMSVIRAFVYLANLGDMFRLRSVWWAGGRTSMMNCEGSGLHCSWPLLVMQSVLWVTGRGLLKFLLIYSGIVWASKS